MKLIANGQMSVLPPRVTRNIPRIQKGDMASDEVVERIVTIKLTPMLGTFCTSTYIRPRQPLCYSIAQALAYRHNIKLKNEKIDDLFASIENRNNFLQQGAQGQHTITKIEKMENPLHSELIGILNKLTEDNFSKMVQQIKVIVPKCTDFCDFFADVVTTNASNQWNFVPLYAQLIINISSFLKSSAFTTRLHDICFSRDKINPNIGFLIGCLARTVFSSQDIYSLSLSLFNERTEISLETLYNLMLQGGQHLDSINPEGKLFLENLNSEKKNIKPTRLRFLFTDLLEARANCWNTEHLMPKSKRTAQETKPIQDENRGSRILNEFVTENVVCSYFSAQMTRDLFIALIEVSKSKFSAGCKIFKILKQKKLINEKTAVQELRETFSMIIDIQYLCDFPNARQRFGALFANLVDAGIVQLTMFGSSSAIPFELNVFSGILNEASEIGITDTIKNSPWMSGLRFRPDRFSHLQLVDVIRNSELVECWPVYDAMASVIYLLEDNEEPEVLQEMLNSEYDKSIIKSKDFSEFIGEFLVIYKPIKWTPVLISYIQNYMNDVLIHIERIGELHQWTVSETASQIEGLASVSDFDLQKFKRLKGRINHTKICHHLFGGK